MTLTEIFRQAVGPDVPISFSAGIDSKNFPLAVACGFVPVTVCSDLLRPGGYGRLPAYLKSLAQAMRAVGAANVDQFIQLAFGEEGGDALTNTSVAADKARNDPRYRAAANRAMPKRVQSHLVTFDCLTCDKCVPVCPNAANFTYPTPIVAFDYHDWIIDIAGIVRAAGEVRRFEIKESMQIANFADYCNDCGNCDTFCPEYGGPYIKKPGFFGSVESWRHRAPRDGFVIQQTNGGASILARIKQREYQLIYDRAAANYQYADDSVALDLTETDHRVLACRIQSKIDSEHRVDLGVFHTLRHLLHGVLNAGHVNQINVGAVLSAGYLLK